MCSIVHHTKRASSAQVRLTVVLKTIGIRLRQRRLELGLTQAAVSRQAAVSPRFLVQLEKGSGNISVQRLVSVCTVLELPLSDLFEGIGPCPPRPLALVGLRGAGKSTVGQALASHLSVPFVELDRQVELEAGMRMRDLFEIRGEHYFREVERRVLTRLLTEQRRQVIATGGGLVTSPQTWTLLRSRSRTVWLRASPDSHFRRVTAQGDLRPMRGRPNARQELESILAERGPLYGLADLVLDTDSHGVRSVVERLASWYGPMAPSTGPLSEGDALSCSPL